MIQKFKHKGIVIVLSGPSGAGKDTVLGKILQQSDDITISVSATTRKPRDQEEEGKSYYFLSTELFEEMVNNGEMLEYVKYCDNYYGTPRRPVNSLLEEGKDVILKIEVEGDIQVRNKCPESVHIFILPPSLKELALRLRSRGTETDEAVNERLKIAKREIGLALGYDYIVINDDPDSCANEIFAIIQAERMKADRMKNFVTQVLSIGSNFGEPGEKAKNNS